MRRAAVLALLAGFWGQGALAGCAGDAAPCETSDGTYHIALPEVENPPVLIFLHGHGGEGAATLHNARLVAPLLARGWAVIAPDGQSRAPGRPRSWTFFPGWEGRDETAFLAQVLADASARFGLDAERAVLGGFSAGAFMVTYLACATPGAYRAYVPVSGGFWRPQPDSCAGPVHLFQTHGWADPVVPLEGRFLGGGRFQQGDIFAGLELWRQTNGCVEHKPDGFDQTGTFLRRHWQGCSGGSLEFALFPGGHTVPEGWADMMADWVEALPAP
ncbi:polyhydroxybutyrate depolymerase [Ruegeria pomeroyi]|nr:polyhydroxybutyrate depolymerase [Ruegeria pomeroyi]